MNRREALTLTATILGGTLVGAQAFLSGCKHAKEKTTEAIAFTEQDVALLDEVGETILPASAESPGAKAAKIGEFMKLIVTDCYSPEEAQTFYAGIGQLEQKAKQQFSKGFMALSADQRLQLLTKLDKEAKQSKPDKHYFGMMKELTLWGYFSSEPGATVALRYNPTPGKYEGCIPYNNEPAWA